MKKRILTLMMLLMMATLAVKANPVDMRTVREVAMRFMNANTRTPLRSVDDLQLVTTYGIDRGDAAFHVFNTPNGFVIVSADDYATPILGYSDEGQFDVNDVPVQLQDYLHDFVEQIQYGIENHVEADEQITRQWELVRTVGRLNENRDGEVVEPLVSALWGQGCYYNDMCPEDPEGPCDHVLTGCVATAMGMILYYWGYPVQGTGSHIYTPMPYPTTQYPEQSVNFGETIYDWANMPDHLTDTSTQTEIAAVASLLWHCGVAVDMNYSPYGSGAEGHFTALIDYFGFSDDMHWEARQDDETWMSMLKADLDHGCPIFYTGYRWANSGHAFVCDGYDVNDRFHFNWGWGGSSNGYFALNAAMLFVYDNDAIFNIHPNTQTITLSEGWNWISTYIDLNEVNGIALLEEALGDHAIEIQTFGDGAEYFGGGEWVGLEEYEWTNAEMVMVYVTEDCTITLAGPAVDPSAVEIEINSGWNWIGFPVDAETNIEVVMGDFEPEEGDIIASSTEGYDYLGEWIDIETLVPGQGYMYYSNSAEPKNLVFQLGSSKAKDDRR